jgi:hypothetical protein
MAPSCVGCVVGSAAHFGVGNGAAVASEAVTFSLLPGSLVVVLTAAHLCKLFMSRGDVDQVVTAQVLHADGAQVHVPHVLGVGALELNAPLRLVLLLLQLLLDHVKLLLLHLELGFEWCVLEVPASSVFASTLKRVGSSVLSKSCHVLSFVATR